MLERIVETLFYQNMHKLLQVWVLLLQPVQLLVLLGVEPLLVKGGLGFLEGPDPFAGDLVGIMRNP